MRIFKAVVILILFSAVQGRAFLEPSFRLKALGEDFVGLVEDEYSDIFRNPAYLGQIGAWKVLGQYRRDRTVHYNFGIATPGTAMGNFGLAVKEWTGENSGSQEQESKYFDYYYAPSYYELTSRFSQCEQITKNRAINFLYAGPSIFGWKMGISIFYDELKYETENSFGFISTTVDIDTFLLLGQREDAMSSAMLSANRSNTISIGMMKEMTQNSQFDFKLAFRHFNSEQGSFEDRLSVQRNYYYDSLGQHFSQNSVNTRTEIDSPIERGDIWSFAGVWKKGMSEYSSINGQIIFSYSSSDFSGRYFDYHLYQDSLSFSDSNLFQEDKNNLSLDLGLAYQSYRSDKVNLFMGIRNILSWEKQNFPDFLRFPPPPRYRNTLHRIVVPLAAEVFPWQKFAVRIGALPSYIFQKGYRFYPNSTGFTTFSSRSESMTYTLGFSLNPITGLKLESYYLGSNPLDNLQNWNLGVTYEF